MSAPMRLGRSTVASNLVREALEKNPDVAARTLARELHRKHPLVFPTVEKARDSVRCQTGQSGNQAKKHKMRNMPFIRPARKPGQHCPQSFELVPGRITTPLTLEPGTDAMILCDVHAPYHDTEIVQMAIAQAKKKQIDTLLLNGDLADCHALSYWERDPRSRRFSEEVKVVREMLAWFRHELPKARIIWKLGNHEERYEREMQTKCPDFLGLDAFELEKVFEVEKFGVEVVKHKRRIMAGRLNILHGHEYKFAISNPVGPARGLFLKSRSTAVVGHFHNPTSFTSKTIEGRPMQCWSLGCACQLDALYAPFNDWLHGWGYVEISKADDFRLESFKVLGGQIYPA